MQSSPAQDFIFSPKKRLLRHVVYWLLSLLVWAGYWTLVSESFPQNFCKMFFWLPAFMLYTYPVVYFITPRLLLRNLYVWWLLTILIWGVMGWYLNHFYRAEIYFPVIESVGIPHGKIVGDPASFLCLTTIVGGMSIASLTKGWIRKQQDLMNAEQERTSAQLQLLKAQLHPHFLFNTLNNIYSFALQNSNKTPQLVLKLSSLLNYVLYDCRDELVPLSKEVEVMKDYIDLEKERYGEKIDISINIEGEIQDVYIAPLLLLPFLENAFKHGTSEQLDRPWMSLDLAVKGQIIICKVVNSKNDLSYFHDRGVGIRNVRERLQLLYSGRHELMLADEGEFFVVSLTLETAFPAVTEKPASNVFALKKVYT